MELEEMVNFLSSIFYLLPLIETIFTCCGSNLDPDPQHWERKSTACFCIPLPGLKGTLLRNQATSAAGLELETLQEISTLSFSRFSIRDPDRWPRISIRLGGTVHTQRTVFRERIFYRLKCHRKCKFVSVNCFKWQLQLYQKKVNCKMHFFAGFPVSNQGF